MRHMYPKSKLNPSKIQKGRNFVHLFKMGKYAYQEYIVVIAPRKVGLFSFWEEMKKMDSAKVFPRKKQALPYAEQLAKDKKLELLLHS